MPPIMTFVQKISAYNLSLLTDKDLPDIALTGLEEGYDSETLRILAGCTSSDNAFQLFDYFKRALSENGIAEIDRKRSLINVVKCYGEQIIAKQLDPYLGFDKINSIVRTTEFDYPDISLNKCYADYITIWELERDGLQLHTGSGLTREQFIEKTKNEMIIDLRKWSTTINDGT
jgi:hypothetical protein